MAAEQLNETYKPSKLFGVFAKGGVVRGEYSEDLNEEELEHLRFVVKGWLQKEEVLQPDPNSELKAVQWLWWGSRDGDFAIAIALSAELLWFYNERIQEACGIKLLQMHKGAHNLVRFGTTFNKQLKYYKTELETYPKKKRCNTICLCVLTNY